MASTKIKIGILGTCPVCEGEFKVNAGRMVHHGFRRPGDGMIHGDCFAVHLEPYERSTDGCEKFKAAQLFVKANLERVLSELPSQTRFTELSVKRDSWTGRKECVTTEYILGVTEPHRWRAIVARRTIELENDIHQRTMVIARMDQLIAAWTLRDLREVTEAQAEAITKADREARAAEKAAKNAEKQAKRDALDAKRAAKEAKKLAFVQAFVADLEKCNGDRAAAALVVAEFRAKKHERALGYIAPYEVQEMAPGKESLFVGLGLAEPAGELRTRAWFNF